MLLLGSSIVAMTMTIHALSPDSRPTGCPGTIRGDCARSIDELDPCSKGGHGYQGQHETTNGGFQHLFTKAWTASIFCTTINIENNRKLHPSRAKDDISQAPFQDFSVCSAFGKKCWKWEGECGSSLNVYRYLNMFLRPAKRRNALRFGRVQYKVQGRYFVL